MRAPPIPFGVPRARRTRRSIAEERLSKTCWADFAEERSVTAPVCLGHPAGFEIDSRDFTKTKREATLAGKSLNM